MSFIDISYSCSKPELARVIDTHLELSVNFDRKILGGQAILIIEKEPFVTEIILDNYKLNISSVKDLVTKRYLNYHLGDNTNFGSPFTIQLPRTVRDVDINTYRIQIDYETNPESPALYWLNAEQTADGKHPFMLSNNKMTYARSVFPCQDTPSVKSTYSAKITVSQHFIVIMSAPFTKLFSWSNCTTSYYFNQTKPIPSYAVIILVGFLRKTKIGLRSWVFAENKFFQKSIETFAEIDRMLLTAENFCGPYVFDTYSICVLPPSISHFKIQCPNVTFVSPVLLGGDISVSFSVASSIAYNWAGYSVTSVNFNHLWLHESFSKFIYIRIINKMFFHDEIAQYLADISFHDLQIMIEKLKDIGLIKSLVPNLVDMLPNDFEQYVPYEMGFILLRELEGLLGGPSVFEPFLKSFFSKFAFKSITTYDWLKFLYESFPEKTTLLNCIDWKTRFFSTTFTIEYCNNFKHIKPITTLEMCMKVAKEWIEWDENSKYLPLTFLDVKTSFDFLTKFFLNYLYHRDVILTPTKIKTMLILYDFQSDVHSYCTRYAWLRLCIKNRWKETIPAALDLAIECCVPNYVCSLFQDLFEWPETHSQLNESYITIKTKLLCETQSKLESILHIK